VPFAHSSRWGFQAKRRVAAFLLGVFASLQILAAVPFLHALVHADCNDPTHECGVTLFAHGQVDAAQSAVGVVVAAPAVVTREIADAHPSVSLDTPPPANRGPPVLS